MIYVAPAENVALSGSLQSWLTLSPWSQAEIQIGALTVSIITLFSSTFLKIRKLTILHKETCNITQGQRSGFYNRMYNVFIHICQRSNKVSYRKLSHKKNTYRSISYPVRKKKKKKKPFLVSLSSISFPENNLCSLTGSHKNRVSHSWIEDSGAALLVRLFSYFHTFLTTDGVQIWILAVLKWMDLRACAVLAAAHVSLP